MKEYVYIQVDKRIRDRIRELKNNLNKNRVRPLDDDEVIDIMLDLYDYKELENEINIGKR